MNEVYKKDGTQPLIACGPSCPVGGCSKSAVQCVEISKPVILSPTAEVGTLTTSCQGTPEVTCETAADGTVCTVTLTQRVCVTIPVTYGVTMDAEDPTIACGGDTCTCGRAEG